MANSGLRIFFLVTGLCLALAGTAFSYSYSDYAWKTFGDSEYALAFAGGWVAGEAEAQALGADFHLVSIGSQDEQDWLHSLAGFGTSYRWIGFTDKVQEGTWKWISGEPVNFTFWNGGEPNNLGDEDYAVMNWSSATGRWNDWDDNTNYKGIIEHVVVPLPPALILCGSGLLGLAAWRRWR